MSTKRGTIFACTSCNCELLCMTGCDANCKEAKIDDTPSCCCGAEMKKKCEPTCVS